MSRSSKEGLLLQVLSLLLLCSACSVAQTSKPVDARIHDLVVALYPQYQTSDYQLSIEGRRMIGLNFPVENWFFSLGPHSPQDDLGYVYNPTSTPCTPSVNLYPEGTCVKPQQDRDKVVLLGRITLGSHGSLAMEISRPEVTDRNVKLRSSLPPELKVKPVEDLLTGAGAKFPPSKRDSFQSVLEKSRLATYLGVKPVGKAKFCISQRPVTASASTPAIYWMSVLASPTVKYLAVFEPFEGDLTVLEPIHDRAQFANSCVQ